MIDLVQDLGQDSYDEHMHDHKSMVGVDRHACFCVSRHHVWVISNISIYIYKHDESLNFTFFGICM